MGRVVAVLKIQAAALSVLTMTACDPGFRNGLGTATPLGSLQSLSMAPEVLSCNAYENGANEKSVRRLSKQELINALTSLFGGDLIKSAEVVTALGAIPDQASSTNAEFDNRIVDVEGLLEVSQTITDKLFQNASLAGQVLGGCNLSDVNACRTALIEKFAYQALRGPLSPELKTELQNVVNQIGGQDGLKAGIMRVLISPQFHQHIELGDTNTGDTTRLRLTPFEVASRLSFRLTGTIPDATLLAAAARGELSTTAQLEMQARRLLATPIARTHWTRFVADWLQLNKISDPHQMIAAEAGVAAQGLGAEASAELLRFAEYIIFDKKGSIDDLFQDKTVFATTDRLANVFGVAKSNQAQTNTAGFAGIILRPAKLLSTGAYTSPILRGVYIRKRVLCEELPSPNQDIVTSRLNELDLMSHSDFSNREITHKLTSGNTCMGCHSLINPVGFALEGFGPLGTPRSKERVYDAQGPTNVAHALDTRVDDLRLGARSVMPADSAEELIAGIVKSPRSKECLSQRLIEGTRYRKKDAQDNCAINDLNTLLHNKAPIADAILKSVVNESIFWKSAEGVER